MQTEHIFTSEGGREVEREIERECCTIVICTITMATAKSTMTFV